MAAVRLAAMHARIKAKQSIVKTEVDKSIADMHKKDDEEYAAELKRRRELAAKLAADQEEAAAKRAKIAQESGAPPVVRKCQCGLEPARLVVKKEGPKCGKAFFKCGKKEDSERCRYFEWEPAGAPEGALVMEVPTAVPLLALDAPPLCKCTLDAVRVTVEKAGPHLGRPFFKCGRQEGATEPRCNYFEWEVILLDRGRPTASPQAETGEATAGTSASSTAGPSEPVNCECGSEAVFNTVKKEGPSCGRRFFSCAGRQCKFFKWESDLIKCLCGTAVVGYVAKKEGPNLGRRFLSCAGRQCKFFKWENEALQALAGAGAATASSNQPSSNQPSTGTEGSARKEDSKCLRCGQTGHWARECPAAKGASDSGQAGQAVDSQGSKEAAKCFKCGQTGHWARACPEAAQKDAKATAEELGSAS